MLKGILGQKLVLKQYFERDLEARGIVDVVPNLIVFNKPNRKYKSKKEKGESMVWCFILGRCSIPLKSTKSLLKNMVTCLS
jgi:hypothetical protein